MDFIPQDDVEIEGIGLNSLQIIAVISICILLYAVMVGALVLVGFALPIAVAVVYIGTVWLMIGMQRRARDCAELQFESAHKLRGNYGDYYRDGVTNRYARSKRLVRQPKPMAVVEMSGSVKYQGN